MGAGGSKNLRVVHQHPQINMAVYRPPESTVALSTAQPKILEDNRVTHNNEQTNEERSERISIQGDTESLIEWEALHTGTFTKYRTSYPELEPALQTIFDYIRLLRKSVYDKSRGFLVPYSQLSKTVKGTTRFLDKHFLPDGADYSEKQNRKLIDFTVEIEGATVMQSFVQNCFDDYYKETQKTKLKKQSTCFLCLFNVLITIQNFTDSHDSFCLASAKAGVVTMCMEIIKRVDRKNQHWQDEDEVEPIEILEACMGILLNISQRLRDRQWFANSDETMLYFAKVKVASVAALALLCLAYLVNEETNHLIAADKDLLRFIITMLDEAWQSEDRRSKVFSAKELAEGLSHLAINDNNKTILGSLGAVRVLTSTLKTSSDNEERASAARALWMLAFDDTNKEVIKQQEGTMDTLRTLHHSQDPEVQKAAAGALWEIEGKTARNNTDKSKDVSGNHVMISYQWDAQEVLVQVKNKLQASGYRVWMDLEQMGGSTLEAMAKAVESATVVLVCVSQRYKESPNCRSEAEYAYQLRKDIIPLMMQNNYKADGWLGMLVGTKLWIGFQSKHVIDSGVTKLIKELGRRGKDVDETEGSPEAVIRPTEASVLTKQPYEPDVSGWTNDDVKKWLREIGLAQVCEEDIAEFTGQTLIELQKLRGECPDYFYKCLEQTLNLKNMFHLFKFRNELEKHFGN